MHSPVTVRADSLNTRTAEALHILATLVPTDIALAILDHAGFRERVRVSRSDPVSYAAAPAAPYLAITIRSAARLRAISIATGSHDQGRSPPRAAGGGRRATGDGRR